MKLDLLVFAVHPDDAELSCGGILLNEKLNGKKTGVVDLTQGELDYNFDFTRNDINIFLDSNFDLTTLSSTWAQNQTFRIVIIPGYFSNKSNKVVDFNDYNAVIKAFNINENKIKTIK